MKIGLQIMRFNWDGIAPQQIGPKLAEIARTADAVGFDSLWVMDHFFQMEMPARGLDAQQPMMDGYTLLSYMAGHTHGDGRSLSPTGTPDQDCDQSRCHFWRTGHVGNWRRLVRT